jgi:hypothetical protein
MNNFGIDLTRIVCKTEAIIDKWQTGIIIFFEDLNGEMLIILWNYLCLGLKIRTLKPTFYNGAFINS